MFLINWMDWLSGIEKERELLVPQRGYYSSKVKLFISQKEMIGFTLFKEIQKINQPPIKILLIWWSWFDCFSFLWLVGAQQINKIIQLIN